MRWLIFLPIFTIGALFSSNLDNRIGSKHLIMVYQERDEETALDLLEEAEQWLSNLRDTLGIKLSSKIQINLYPDIHSHHLAIGNRYAPSWLVARSSESIIDIVTPTNPGPIHTDHSIRKILELNIVKVLLKSHFGAGKIPSWLAFGIGAYYADYESGPLPDSIPSIETLENCNAIKFADYRGFSCAKDFVSFFIERKNLSTLLRVIKNYTSVNSCEREELLSAYHEWAISKSM